jgi:cysteine desulfurase
MAIYLDNAATTKIDSEALNKLIETHKNNYGNPSSLHKMGVNAEKIYKSNLEYISNMINTKPSNVIITSGGTEGNNTGLWQIIRVKNKKKKILTTKVEHPSVTKYWEFLKEEKGIEVQHFGYYNNGEYRVDDLYEKIDESTGLITIPFVNSEIGFLQNIEEMTQKIKEISKEVLIHVDGVQGFGKLKIDVSKLKIDTMSFSSHKIHGPKGLGGLYIKEPDKFVPLLYGGGQQKNLRSGTEDIPSIASFGKTCEIAIKTMDENYEKVKRINKMYRELLPNYIEEVIFNGNLEKTSPYILNLSIKDIKSEVLIHFLEMDDIYISSGSACSSNYKGISETYQALNIPQNFLDGTVRISFGRYSNEKDVKYVVEKIAKYTNEIRKMVRR